MLQRPIPDREPSTPQTCGFSWRASCLRLRWFPSAGVRSSYASWAATALIWRAVWQSRCWRRSSRKWLCASRPAISAVGTSLRVWLAQRRQAAELNITQDKAAGTRLLWLGGGQLWFDYIHNRTCRSFSAGKSRVEGRTLYRACTIYPRLTGARIAPFRK